MDLALKVKSQKIESLDLTPPNVTPSDPDFDAARTLVADTIEESSKDAEKDKGAQTAPGGSAGAVAGVNASLRTVGSVGGTNPQISAQGSAEGGSDEDKESAEREICYVP